jgi:hypothetical protein
VVPFLNTFSKVFTRDFSQDESSTRQCHLSFSIPLTQSSLDILYDFGAIANEVQITAVHQSKYPHYDVAEKIPSEHCNVRLISGGAGIVMSEIKKYNGVALKLWWLVPGTPIAPDFPD